MPVAELMGLRVKYSADVIEKSKERLYLIDKELEHRRAVDEPEITETP